MDYRHSIQWSDGSFFYAEDEAGNKTDYEDQVEAWLDTIPPDVIAGAHDWAYQIVNSNGVLQYEELEPNNFNSWPEVIIHDLNTQPPDSSL